MAGNYGSTGINDIPDVILSNIIYAVADVRTRNAASLVCHKWWSLERSTRSSITLRGNLRRLFDSMVPNFPSVAHLDLSLLSPWGHSLLPSSATLDPILVAHVLHQAFPSVQSLTVYARNPETLQLLAPKWPHLKQIKLVRWHQRPQLPSGSDFEPLFLNCLELQSLDLSNFYCWTDDVPPALQSHPLVATKLTRLNLLNPSLPEGFKSQELEDITRACPNLEHFIAACVFDPRYIGFVGDQTLRSMPGNCPKLSLLHLADTSSLTNARGDPNHEGYTHEDARITVLTLIEVFSSLPLLEELALDICHNIRDSGPALEMLNTKCPRLKSLKLGQFHGICMAIESRLDGVALCQGLESLSIRNVADLTDMGLIAIARGCSRLAKLEVEGCKKITVKGMRTLATLLRKTLVDVKISCCKNLGAASSLTALDPIQAQIQRLHIDCVWDSVEQSESLDGVEFNFDLNKSEECNMLNQTVGSISLFESKEDDYVCRENKKCKYSYDPTCSSIPVCSKGNANGNGNGFYEKEWSKLQYLSLWIGVGELLTPLAVGLGNCPNLEEIRIKVEGDCREWSRPSEKAFGLSSLGHYPRLSKMTLDCGETIGFAHTAPTGQMDLSLWERFYLFGIGELSINVLDYWPPQDRDVNQRSLSQPAVALLRQSFTLRKLYIHGTAHEHFLMFLPGIPSLRDVQLRQDYYPAPENDMSTEMRAESCIRFDDALNRRQVDD